MSNFIRLFAIGVAPVLLAACASPPPSAATSEATQFAMAVDLGSSGRVASTGRDGRVGEGHEWSEADGDMVQMAHEGHSGTHAAGTVNSVDIAQNKINLSHAPIPELGWPAMTMDFAVAPTVDLRSVKPGSRVKFSLGKGKDGMYQIRSLEQGSGE